MLEHDFQRDRSSEKHNLTERSNSSRDTVHTLGQAVRPGMFSDKPTDLFRSDYPTSLQKRSAKSAGKPKRGPTQGTNGPIQRQPKPIERRAVPLKIS